MQLSARNQLTGTVRGVELGTVMAEVIVDVNGQQIVSAITRASAERLGLAEGQPVTVFLKATEVILGVEEALPTPGAGDAPQGLVQAPTPPTPGTVCCAAARPGTDVDIPLGRGCRLRYPNICSRETRWGPVGRVSR